MRAVPCAVPFVPMKPMTRSLGAFLHVARVRSPTARYPVLLKRQEHIFPKVSDGVKSEVPVKENIPSGCHSKRFGESFSSTVLLQKLPKYIWK